MTNEQTALLIEQYRRQLVDIYARLKEDLVDVEGLEHYRKRVKWIGEGELPSVEVYRFAGEDVALGEDEEVKRFNDPDNWEWENTEPKCLDDLETFLSLLNEDVESLTE